MTGNVIPFWNISKDFIAKDLKRSKYRTKIDSGAFLVICANLTQCNAQCNLLHINQKSDVLCTEIIANVEIWRNLACAVLRYSYATTASVRCAKTRCKRNRRGKGGQRATNKRMTQIFFLRLRLQLFWRSARGVTPNTQFAIISFHT